MKSKVIGLMGLVSLCTQLTFAQNAVEGLGQMPYKHAKKCDTMLDTRGFEVYPNKDCSVLYIAPPSVEKPVNTGKLYSSVDMCKDNSDWLETLSILVQNMKSVSKKLSAAIEKENYKQVEILNKEFKEAQSNLIFTQKEYARYFSIPASEVQTTLTNEVNGDDRHNLFMQNMYIYLNEPLAPDLDFLQPENSFYSFVHYRPENVSEEARSILSTTIPGLEVLVQNGSKQTNVAHVKANNVSGQTVFSLMATCPLVEKKNDDWIFKKGALRDVMTVTRNYEVPMRVGYGIKARLHSKMASEVFAQLLAKAENNGLTKTQIYEKFLTVSGTDVFTVEINTDIPLPESEKVALEHDVRKRLTDRFLLHYEERGVLADLRPVEVQAPTGGMVPVEQVGTKCWKKSSWGGLKKSGGCHDYIYTVQKWRDGKTEAEIHDFLMIDIDISEEKIVNDVVKVPMSTVFLEEEN